jgi:hypothetical protein
MKENIPEPIRKAMERKEFFWGPDGGEWNLEIKSDTRDIEKIAGVSVLVFANNGYGDYMFVKQEQGGFGEQAFLFLHEGPEVETLGDDLETLLGLKARAASADKYPSVVYQTGEPVLVGDKVLFKAGLFFWKGWMGGVVEYVPGISPLSSEHEHNGLKWASIRGKDMVIGALVDPQTGILRKIRFVDRAPADSK